MKCAIRHYVANFDLHPPYRAFPGVREMRDTTHRNVVCHAYVPTVRYLDTGSLQTGSRARY